MLLPMLLLLLLLLTPWGGVPVEGVSVGGRRGTSRCPPRDKAPPPAYGYEGGIGPLHWGGTCATGQLQSPLNFGQAERALLSTTRQPRVEQWIARVPARGLAGGHHGPELSFTPGSLGISNIGRNANLPGMRKVAGWYALKGMHMHAPSEHHIDGTHLPLELHMVHAHPDTGKLAVLGFLVDFGERSDPAFEALLPLVEPPAAGRGDARGKRMPEEECPLAAGESETDTTVNLTGLLATLQGSGINYRYNGSLTTPPCTEGVEWYVVARPVTITLPDYARLQRAIGFNARPTAALGGAGRVMRGEL